MEDRKVRIAINGLGRIGRQALKACLGITDDLRMQLSSRIDPREIEVVAVNDLTDARILAHLIRYDTVYGRYEKEILVKHNQKTINWEGHTATVDHGGETLQGDVLFVIGGCEIQVLNEKDPAKLPWDELKVDVVLECTGAFTNYEKAKVHIDAGAKQVVISAPGKGDEGTIGQTAVIGTDQLAEIIGQKEVYSNASCTTNSIAPVIQLLHNQFKIEKALMTTVHAYTASQSIVDGPDAKDIRRGRAAAVNIIPSTTGAAIATTHVIPDLKENFDGIALRVPVVAGSVSDITAVITENTTVDQVADLFIEAANSPQYQGIILPSREPIVSTDIIGNPASAIVDLDFIRVVGGNLVKVLVWYDNEWGYSNRLVEMAVELGRSI